MFGSLSIIIFYTILYHVHCNSKKYIQTSFQFILFISLQECPYRDHKVANICYSWLFVNNWLFGQPIEHGQLTFPRPLRPITFHPARFHHQKTCFHLKFLHVHGLVYVYVRPPFGPSHRPGHGPPDHHLNHDLFSIFNQVTLNHFLTMFI